MGDIYEKRFLLFQIHLKMRIIWKQKLNKVSVLYMNVRFFFEDIHKSDLYDFCKNIGINCSFVPRNILFSEANFLIALGGDGTIRNCC